MDKKTIFVKCWKCGKPMSIFVTKDSIIVQQSDNDVMVDLDSKHNLKPNHWESFQVQCQNKECNGNQSGTATNMLDFIEGYVLPPPYQTPPEDHLMRAIKPVNVDTQEPKPPQDKPKRGDQESNPILGRQPTPSENDWIQEDFNNRSSSFTTMSDLAKTLVTLSTTLSGVYLALLAGVSLSQPVGSGAKHLYFPDIVPYIPWGIALLCAVLSLTPISRKVRSDSPSQIRSATNFIRWFKYWLLMISVTALAVGLELAAWRVFNLVKRV